MTDGQVYIGRVGGTILIQTTMDLTDNASISVKVWDPAGVAKTPLTGTAVSPVTTGDISVSPGTLFSDSSAVAGIWTLQPFVTFADGSVLPCNAYDLAVYAQSEVP
jgi:hypothetical protein